MTIAFGSSASLSGLLSARPAADAGQVGRLYFATDTNDLYRDNGTAWQHIGTARTYKVYTALLTQVGLAAPTAIVLENTLGETVTWEYVSEGLYQTTNTFAASKTVVLNNFALSGGYGADVYHESGVSNTVQIHTFSYSLDGIDITGLPINSVINLKPIEIRVYP